MSIGADQVIDGKYRVVKLLGQGGMGAVYLAEHLVIGRRVALKVLLGSVAENETAVARFEREAQAAARIGNDHILEIYDFGSLPDGARYMVCEFLEGETLAARLDREQRLSPAAIIPLAVQLLSGLEAAHRAGVVHRDLKPENVFILKQKAGIPDFVKIIDFGISKFQTFAGGEAGMQMTATGIVVGTPCYLSPEQARGSREADARSDLYAVGVMLYEALTGQLPFESQNVNDLLFKIVLENPRPILELAPDLDPDFAQIVATAMARDPDQRFQNALALAQALESWASLHAVPLRASISGRPITGGVAARSGESLASEGPTRSLAPTPGTWADSKVSVAAFRPPTHSRKALAAGLAVAGVLAAGGAFALLSGSSTDDGAAAPSAHTAASQPAASASAPVAEPLNRREAELVVPVAPTGDPAALLAPPTPEESAARKPAPPKPAATAPRARSTPAPAPKPAPKKPASTPSNAAPATTATATTRRHRDYGY